MSCTSQSAAVVSSTEHYDGRANQDANGDYYIMGIDGYLWSDSLTETASVNVWVDQQ